MAMMLDSSFAGSGGLERIADALVSGAYAGSPARLHAHGVPEPGDNRDEEDRRADPRDPRPPHKPGDTQPLDAPPVPRLRPLE